MRVLVTGATGFTGHYVVEALLREGHQVDCFARPSSDVSRLGERVEVRQGDLGDVESLTRSLRGAQALVNVASIGFGHAPGIVQAARQSQVERAIFFSTTAIFTTLPAQSKSKRLAAEKAIAESGLKYTILRPTMIYGSSRDRNMCRLVDFLKRWPLIPIFGDGRRLQQPVYVEDLAWAAAACLREPKTIGKIYNLSGAAPLTYRQVIETVNRELGRRVRMLPLPSGPIVSMLRTFERLGLPAPIKSEQVQRLNEDKAFDFEEAARDFGYRPRGFQEGIRLQLREMGLRS